MIILFLRFGRRKQSKLDHLFINVLICNVLLLLFNVLSWVMDGQPGDVSRVAILLLNFLVYVLQYLLMAIFTNYFVAYISENGGNAAITKRIVWGITLVGIVLVAVSQFNHMYYVINAQNVYVRQDLFWLYPMFGIAGVLMALSTLIRWHKCLKKKETLAFFLYLIVPIAALIVQTLFYGAIFLYISTTFAAICIYVFIQAEQSRKLSEKELELERSHTSIMLSQIQPHFLYNSLLGIKQLCDIDPQKASKALEHFAYYLRGNLDSLSDKPMIFFEKELGHVKNYLHLEKMRFGDRLNIIWDISFKDFMLPPLTLQPIVENAVRYGVTKKKAGGTLTIQTKKDGDTVKIVVLDDGVGFDENVSEEKNGCTHIGLQNVRSRIKTQCNGELRIESNAGAGAKVTIVLPLKRLSHEV